jgi:hypothetical protein
MISTAPSYTPCEVRRDELKWFTRVVADAVIEQYPDAGSIVWKGSSVKPWEGPFDFIPGLSDLDVQVYRRGGVTDPWQLRRAVLDEIGDSPLVSALQLLVLDPDDLPDPWYLYPGTFEVLYGDAPEVTPVDPVRIAEEDRIAMLESADQAYRLEAKIVGLGDAELWRYLQRAHRLFSPVLYRAATISGNPPDEIWPLNRTRLLERTAGDDGLAPIRSGTIEYYAAAVDAGLTDGLTACVEEAVRAGQHLLRSAAAWIAAR